MKSCRGRCPWFFTRSSCSRFWDTGIHVKHRPAVCQLHFRADGGTPGSCGLPAPSRLKVKLSCFLKATAATNTMEGFLVRTLRGLTRPRDRLFSSFRFSEGPGYLVIRQKKEK